MLDWIMNFIGGDYNQKQIDALMPLVRDINYRYAEFDALSDAEIQAKTEEFKQFGWFTSRGICCGKTGL